MDWIGIATKLVLVLLMFLSIWSVAIMWDRRKFFRGLASNFPHRFRSQLPDNQALHQSQLELLYSAFVKSQRLEMDRGLNVLATLGSNAPFIGLFGTVLGIIQSFGLLSQSQGDMNGVMFAIAEALIATAVGLAVAIPAVIAYNTFTKRMKDLITQSDIAFQKFLAERSVAPEGM